MLHCFPTTDVHLLTAAGRNQSIDLFVFARWPPHSAAATWTDLSTVPQLRLGMSLVAGQTTVTVTSNVTGSATPVAGPVYTVAPAAVGTTIGQTSVSHPTVQITPSDAFRLLRMTVHADIDRFWIPLGSITMFAGESNRVLPITAIFDDQSQGDATGHPYWIYRSSDGTIATVDPDGRVHARAAGTVTLTVTLAGTARAQTISATILPPLSDGHGAKVIQSGSVAGDRVRVYVISEGYADPTRFEDHFKQVVDRWFATPENRPFDLLRDRYAVFGISDPVAQQGITIGPVLDSQARATPTTILPAALTQPLRVVDERDTRFGVMYGGRLGDPEMRPGLPPSLAQWLTPARAHRMTSIDWRRVPDVHSDPGPEFMAYLRRYLAAVASNASNMPDGFGELTAEDRVVLLCDDQLRGGVLLAVAGMLEPERLVVSAAAGSDSGFDHVAAVAGEPRRFDRTVSYLLLRDAVASTVVHEIGHSYRLGDEYESKRGRAAVGPDSIAELEPYENVQLLDELNDPQLGGVRTSWIKWNLPRVVAAARVTGIVVTNLKVGMAVPGADKQAWITEGAKLMLRPTLRNPRSAPQTQRLPLYEVTVTSVSPDVVIGNTFFVVPEPEFTGGGVLFQPKVDATGMYQLIDSTVGLDIATNGAFPKPPVRVPDPAHAGSCFDQDPAAANDQVVPGRAFNGGPTTTDRWRIIGLYEGGNDISCGIGRPSGRCKLRLAFDFSTNTVWRFCHVCQYVIVDLVDPSQHARLDRDYPP